MASKKTFLIFFLILAVGMAVRTWLVMEPVNSDPIAYLLAGAGRYLDPDFRLALHHHYLRPLMTWAVMLPALISGYSQTTYYATVFLGAAFSFLSWWLIASVLSGTRAAIMVTAFWATSFASLSADLMIVPDNWGICMALFGLASMTLAMRSLDHHPSPWNDKIWRDPRILSLMGGLWLWLACAAKETFVIYVLAVGMVILLHRRRWLLSFFMLVGLILGLLIEWAWFWVQLGDPFARIHYLRGINAVVDGVNANFETLNLVSFLLRFPRVVHYTQSAESTLFLLAIFGFLLWCRQWKNLEAKIKLILFVVPPAFVILSVKGISPIQPYFDIVLRYYVPFLPFVYLAVADFFLWGLTRWRQNHGKTLRYAFQFAVVASCSVMMLWNLLIAAEQMPRVKKNGFDSNTRIQSAIDVDSAQTHTPKRIYLNGGMESIGPLYFPAKEGWTTGVATGMDNILPVFSEPGYFILSWPRINSSGNERPFALSRLFLDYPLIFRHHVHDAVTDVYRVGPQKIKREQTVLSLRSWTVTGADGQSSPGVARVPKDGQIMMGSGGAFEPAEPLVAGKWLHIRLQGKTENSFAILKGYLHDLNHGTAPDKPRILPLGVFYFERVAHKQQEMSFVTFISQPIDRYRLVLKAEKAAIAVEGVVVSLLQPDLSDRFLQSGDSW